MVKKNTHGRHRWTLDEVTKDLIRGLARLLPDKAIAAVLNRSGKVTGRNKSLSGIIPLFLRAYAA